MKPYRDIGHCLLPLWKMVLIFLLMANPEISAAQRIQQKVNTIVWDTQSPFVNIVDVRSKTTWKVVPADLLTLELDPSAAISDPAYYGREYSFKGDVVVENRHLTAVFLSGKGKVVIYSKTDLSRKKIEFFPLQLKGKPASINHCSILQNTGDEVALEVSFSGRGAKDSFSAIFSFDQTGIIEIKPAENMKGVCLLSPIAFGVLPDFIGDDLIYDPEKYPSGTALHVPSENLFLGLLEGQNNMLVVTWPKGRQQMRLALSKSKENRLIESVDFDNDGKNIYLALLNAPGIWHKEELKPTYLEKDVAVNWKRPFRAKWITQLIEADVKTTFTFKESKETIWRGVTGRYNFPVWFDGGKTFYRLGKKVPPKGYSLVYALERKGTPAAISTPVDILKATLGRHACDAILDLPGRKLRTHHRRGAAGVRRAATCGCTEAMQVVFDAGEEVKQKEYVADAVDDMVYFVTRHVERIEEYQDFANNMIKYLNLEGKSSGVLKPYIDNMRAIVQEIPQGYQVQKENMKSLAYAAELSRKTKALTRKKDPKNLPIYNDLSLKWRRMGGAQDTVIGQCHTITRKLFQEAGYGCVNQPGAVKIAREIRRRCRQCLRNPDGYEIWENY
ncbi:MAG: hypothetical protein GY845_15860 [Planctomycetes bacterium]|nr:hypothetical protein [Planctomycetota bacterium]